MLRATDDTKPGHGWTFLTNHAHVLLCLEREPEMRLRDLAQIVGITERAVQRIVAELEEAGYLARERVGRCNRYEINQEMPLRHAVENHQTVASLIRMVNAPPGERGAKVRQATRAAEAPRVSKKRREP